MEKKWKKNLDFFLLGIHSLVSVNYMCYIVEFIKIIVCINF